MKESKTVRAAVATLIKPLAARNRDIISRRFGLQTGKRETLESIGQSYGITRERVRQIEEFTKAQLAKIIADAPDVAYGPAVAKFLTAQGGVASEAKLFQEFSGSDKPSPVNASLAFLLALGDQAVRSEEGDDFSAFWALSGDHASDFRVAANKVHALFAKHGKAVPAGTLGEFVGGAGSLDQKSIAAVMAVSKKIGRNIFNEIGLADWPHINPKGVRDKAFLVLQRSGKPEHFTSIAKLIGQAGFGNGRGGVNTQTVHNELIKDKRFVLVGRGLYGLSEWGYKPGTVKDVMRDVLSEAGKPLSKADLVAKVLGVRMVKENTVLLNLQDSSSFVRNSDGTYEVRKA